MTSIADLLRYVELSFGSYADFSASAMLPSDLEDAEFALAHAQHFASKWRKVDQFEQSNEPYWITDPTTGQQIGPYTATNGLSATVFENVTTRERVLAIRGTDDAADVATDVVSVLTLGSPKNQGQYQSLRTKVQEWIANGTLPQHFSVTGHSLGGFLATGLALEFPQYVDHAYLYNSPGLGGLTNRPVLDSSGSRRHRIRPGSTRSDSDSHSSASVRTAWPENGCGCVLLSHPATTLTDPRSPNVLGLSDDCGQAYRFR